MHTFFFFLLLLLFVFRNHMYFRFVLAKCKSYIGLVYVFFFFFNSALIHESKIQQRLRSIA